MTHADLVVIAGKWLRKARGCGAVLTELVTYAGETPDAIGWRDGFSYKIECKVSRSDFLADKKKPSHMGLPESVMGSHRYYMCPDGLIKEEELPDGWGLIYVNERGKARLICGQKSNAKKDDKYFFDGHVKGLRNEIRMLTSAIRRTQESNTTRAIQEAGG